MLDFTSALYLGLRHSAGSLEPWSALSLGKPAVLREPPGAQSVAMQLAQLQGCESALLLPSTLHLFWDLFQVLGREPIAILRDAGLYAMGRWGTERAAALGIPVHVCSHHDADRMARLAWRLSCAKRRPVIVTDGFCPACGNVAPIGAYAEIAARYGGYLVIDDTQALGILGESPRPGHPYGEGGGGSLRWHQAFGPHILVASSLAKGFGAPVSVLAGSREIINRFRLESETRVHCSPPSLAVIHAAHRALLWNRNHGDALRARLLRLVTRLRARLSSAGLDPVSALAFPVQSFVPQYRNDVALVYQRLLRCGISALLTNACRALTAVLTFIVTTRHRIPEIDYVGRMTARTNTPLEAS